MGKSTKVKPVRGRPATGKDPLVGVRMATDLTNQIDQWAQQKQISRSEAIRRLIELGLKKID